MAASDKKDIIPQLLWYISIFTILVVFSTIALLESGFSHLQMSIFTTNLLVVLILIRNKLSLLMIALGVGLGILIFENAREIDANIPINLSALVYISLIFGCIFVIFLQPSFRNEKTSKFINKILNQQLKDQSLHMMQLASYRQEFISK